MDNNTILLKIRQRLNKLSSNDYDNLLDWQVIELFSKGATEWCRRNLHGLNAVREGDEQSTSRIDDLEVLLTETPPLALVDRQTFFQTVQDKPADYLRYKRFSCSATSECCSNPQPIVVYLAEEANVPILLRDKVLQPSFEWRETFATYVGNKIRIYTNGEFTPVNFSLMYYRQPRRIQIPGVADPYTGVISTTTVNSEFKDDLIELFIDEAYMIAAGDTENAFQMNRGSKSVETNN